MLKAAGQPLAAFVTPYADPDDPAALDPDALAQRFMHYRNNPDKLRELYRGLLGLTLTARNLGRDWPLRGVSLRGHLRDRLTRTFADGFEVLIAGPVLAWEPADGETVLRHAGKTVPGATELPAATEVVEE